MISSNKELFNIGQNFDIDNSHDDARKRIQTWLRGGAKESLELDLVYKGSLPIVERSLPRPDLQEPSSSTPAVLFENIIYFIIIEI